MSKGIQHLVVDTQDILEVIDEITNDNQLLPYDLEEEVYTESIEFVTNFAKKTGDYSSLSATDIKVLALAYQIDKKLVGLDHFNTEPTAQGTIKVTELANNTSNPENEDDANESEKSTKPKETEPPKQPASDSSKINIPGADGAEQGADWSAKKIDGSDVVHLYVQNLIRDNFKDQKLAEDVVNHLQNLDLRDEYDADHFIPNGSSDDEDSDNDYPDTDYDSDGDDEYYSIEKSTEMKQEKRIEEVEDRAVEAAN